MVGLNAAVETMVETTERSQDSRPIEITVNHSPNLATVPALSVNQNPLEVIPESDGMGSGSLAQLDGLWLEEKLRNSPGCYSLLDFQYDAETQSVNIEGISYHSGSSSVFFYSLEDSWDPGIHQFVFTYEATFASRTVVGHTLLEFVPSDQGYQDASGYYTNARAEKVPVQLTRLTESLESEAERIDYLADLTRRQCNR